MSASVMEEGGMSMAEPSFWETAFTEAQELLQTEADGFANVIQTVAGFDVISNCGTAINVFEAAGTALLTLFFCMEAFTYCANIDFHGGIEGAIRIAMKLVVSALIVQNVDNIVGGGVGTFETECGFFVRIFKYKLVLRNSGNGRYNRLGNTGHKLYLYELYLADIDNSYVRYVLADCHNNAGCSV